jgi:hypothetical protein
MTLFQNFIISYFFTAKSNKFFILPSVSIYLSLIHLSIISEPVPKPQFGIRVPTASAGLTPASV